MVLESVPMEIGGDIFHLRFEDADIVKIEQRFKPVMMLFQPASFGFDVARVFLWKGLKKQEQNGALTYAFTQDVAGYDAAFQAVKKFTSNFPGPVLGLSIIYASINKALVVSGWYRDPEVPKEETTEPVQEIDPSKNSPKPTSKRTRKSHTDSVG